MQAVPADLHALLPRVIEATRAAAVPVMVLFRTAAVWDKDGGQVDAGTHAHDIANPLTEADLAADTLLRERLPPLLPGSGWMSEETADSDTRRSCDFVWIVDPIDGTREYVEGVPHFAISVALAHRGDVVLAVLLNPAQDDLHTAIAGAGATRNGQPVPRASATVLADSTLLASRTETRKGDFEPFKRAMKIREVGSTAWKLALAAAGEGDVYFTRKPRNEWDVAAGILLCREAGMTVTDLGGEPHRFNRPSPLCRGVVAAAPALHGPVMALIASVGTLE